MYGVKKEKKNEILTFSFLNLLSARQPHPLWSLKSETVRYLKCCLILRVWYAKELNIPLVFQKIVNHTNADQAFICHQRSDSFRAKYDSIAGLESIWQGPEVFVFDLL